MINEIFSTTINTLYNIAIEEPSLERLQSALNNFNNIEIVHAVVQTCLATGSVINLKDVVSINCVTCDHMHIIICELSEEFTDMVKDFGETQNDLNPFESFITAGRVQLKGHIYTVIFTAILNDVMHDNNCSHFRTMVETMTTEYYHYLENELSPYVENYIMDPEDDIMFSSAGYGLFYAPSMLCKQLGMDLRNDRPSNTDEFKLFVDYVTNASSPDSDKFWWTELFDTGKFCSLLSIEKYERLVFKAFDEDEEEDDCDDE